MTVSSTLEYLKSMRLSAMAEELKKQTEEPNAFSHLGFEERIALIVDAEWNRRQANKLKRYINTARFSNPIRQDFLIPAPLLRILSIMRTGILTKPRFCASLHADILTTDDILSFAALLAMVKRILPVLSATRRAENSNL